jgi:hypothetical protein
MPKISKENCFEQVLICGHISGTAACTQNLVALEVPVSTRGGSREAEKEIVCF